MKIKYIVYEVSDVYVMTDNGEKLITVLSEMDTFETEDQARDYIFSYLKTSKKKIQLTYMKVFYN